MLEKVLDKKFLAKRKSLTKTFGTTLRLIFELLLMVPIDQVHIPSVTIAVAKYL